MCMPHKGHKVIAHSATDLNPAAVRHGSALPTCCHQSWCHLCRPAGRTRKRLLHGRRAAAMRTPSHRLPALTLVSVVGLRPGSSRMSRLACANSADRFISSHKQPRPIKASAASTCTSVCTYSNSVRAVQGHGLAHIKHMGNFA